MLFRSPREKKEKEDIPWQELEMESETDESISKINVLIQVTQESDIPTKGTNSAAVYDLRAETNIKLEPQKVTRVPLKIQMAIPPNYFV